MAAIALERVMGQHDQRTLHPFFGKGPKDTDLPSSECKPLRSLEPEGRVPVRKDTVKILIDPTSGSDRPNQSCEKPSARGSRKRDKQLQLPLTSNVHEPQPITRDEDVNGSRKKRRKTYTPESAGQVTEEPLWQHTVQQNPAPSLGAQLEAAARNEADAVEQQSGNQSGVELPAAVMVSEELQNQPSSSSSVNIHPKSDDPPIKTLRLNPNGKLLNSPVRSKSTPRDPDGPNKKKKSVSQKRSKKHSVLVSLGYGANEESRSSIGQQINEIIGGRKRYPLSRDVVCDLLPSHPPQQSSKPTHPFFLGKAAAQITEAKCEQGEDIATDRLACAQNGRAAATNRLSDQGPQHSQQTSNLSQQGNYSNATAAKARSLLPQNIDPTDPIWPPRGAVHVRGLPPNDDNNFSFVDFEERKAKGLVASIPEYENILCVKSQLFSHIIGSDIRSAVLRSPKKKICTRDTFMGIVMSRLGLAPMPTEMIGENVHRQRTSIPYTSHPAVAQLLSSVRSSTTAFDQGESDDSLWTQKYAPNGADSVLQLGTEALVLKRWLRNLTVSTVSSGASEDDGKQTKKIPGESAKRKKRRKRPKDLDEFIVSSDDDAPPQMDEIGTPNDEDELAGGVTISNKRTVVRSDSPIGDTKSVFENRLVANSILISGPSGCGKTAAVHAVAKELGFEIFEINAGSRRSARDVVERVGNMTQNHLVQLLGQVNDKSRTAPSLKSMFSTHNSEPGKQSTVKTFFGRNMNTPETKREDMDDEPAFSRRGPLPKAQPSQKQSLILLEEVDILFEEDKQFWSGVLTLISQSKRPVILTCNDERLVPLEQLKPHAILRFRQPPRDLAVDYLLLLAANEGHILDREWISELYTVMRLDLRAAIMQLNFWCQMGVGSKKSGLDWLTMLPVRHNNQTHEDNRPKIVSTDTYVHGMGLVCQDLTCDDDAYERRSQLMFECLGQWQIGLMDWHESNMYRDELRGHDGQSRLEALVQESQKADMMANLDMICRGSPESPTDDVFDLSWPKITSKQRSTYTEGYKLLQTDLLADYACLATKIGVAMTVLLDNSFHDSSPSSDENTIIQQTLEKFSSHKPVYLNQSILRNTFEPIIDDSDPFNAPSGRQSFSFDGGTASISEDLAPYIRAIVAFDLRLEQHRLALSGPLPHDSKSSKRIRTTRASLAALEGGDKASVRKDRWFTGKLNTSNVLATGCPEWQDALRWKIQRISVSEGGNQSMDEQDVASSSEGGI
ncbi:telomere length regulation protein elg1 [Histoplasma capsulatum var. duboisii H88]|uniref:Telomere length regulation protein elg1 n=1 Tax=Ajellomyces capsulatus (strain H88) TaxID=544711 RepID=A0A8A1LME6_AJEC8|nr:telomere length regulation protein elg1 [Histoplasma capsulatum var. duboisii H88]